MHAPPSKFFLSAVRTFTGCAAFTCIGHVESQEPAILAAAPVQIRVYPDKPIVKISDDFLGFGYETSAVAQPDFFSVKNVQMVQFYRTLSPHGLIRIGGNVSDHTRYVPDGAPAVHSEREVTVINKTNLTELGEFLRATGWKTIWGLNLGTGSKEEAVAEALAVQAALGTQLHSFEIGNEVDFLPRFAKKFDAYHAAYREYKAAIRAALPDSAFSGPDVAWGLKWSQDFAAAESGDLRLLTQHYYRGGASQPQATMEHLLARDADWEKTLAALRQACEGKQDLAYRICEVNSFYGGGKPGVSDTLGAALWCLDYLFVLASNGAGGVNLETDVNHLAWISHYSPLVHDAPGQCAALPEYYAMLAFSLAGQGEIVTLTQGGDAAFNLRAYATRNTRGEVWVTAINKDLARDADLEITVPGSWTSASVYPLRAPAVDSKDQVTLAGAEVATDGTWTSQSPVPITARDGTFHLTVLHASATLLRLQH